MCYFQILIVCVYILIASAFCDIPSSTHGLFCAFEYQYTINLFVNKLKNIGLMIFWIFCMSTWAVKTFWCSCHNPTFLLSGLLLNLCKWPQLQRNNYKLLDTRLTHFLNQPYPFSHKQNFFCDFFQITTCVWVKR